MPSVPYESVICEVEFSKIMLPSAIAHFAYKVERKALHDVFLVFFFLQFVGWYFFKRLLSSFA